MMIGRTIRGVALALCAMGLMGASLAPADGDAFSKLAARAEAGDASLDFRALRLAWLDSAQRKRHPDIAAMRRELTAAANAQDTARVMAVARRIIAADYIDMGAHKYLRQACKAAGDAACADHEHFVEFGLLQSITTGRDGKSPASAWRVVSIDEEYFIMGMAGAALRQQSLTQDHGRPYDRMDVTFDGRPMTLWFDIGDFLSRELE